jgi:hypothetical protein
MLGVERWTFAAPQVVAFVARSSADEWDNIIPYDHNQNQL